MQVLTIRADNTLINPEMTHLKRVVMLKPELEAESGTPDTLQTVLFLFS